MNTKKPVPDNQPNLNKQNSNNSFDPLNDDNKLYNKKNKSRNRMSNHQQMNNQNTNNINDQFENMFQNTRSINTPNFNQKSSDVDDIPNDESLRNDPKVRAQIRKQMQEGVDKLRKQKAKEKRAADERRIADERIKDEMSGWEYKNGT
eukprot:UN30593